MITPIEQLQKQGQSVWFDYIRRGLITSGELQRMVDDGWITGITSNPTIFRKAISGSSDYDQPLSEIAKSGQRDPYEAFLALASEDIRLAADVLRPIYDQTNGKDGYVSFEAPPAIANDAGKTVAEAKRLFELVGRPNVMIKVPGTPAGVQALERLTADGLSVNLTLLFSVDVYEQVARAYIGGLVQRLAAGKALASIASVASFFVSRVESKADALLPAASPLRGKIAVANAQTAYKRFREIFSGAAWERLAAEGARVQQPLWASTGTKNPEYSDVLYIEELIAPDTVNTMPEATLRAFLDHGKARPSIEEGLTEAEQTLQQAAKEGFDLKTVTDTLLEEGLASFANDFDALLQEIEKTLRDAPSGRDTHNGELGGLTDAVRKRLEASRDQDISRRIWSFDHTLWKPEPTEIADRLGWLNVVDTMLECADELGSFAQQVAADGYDTAVLLGMGGSSLAPEVLYSTFGATSGALTLRVLDTTDPTSIRAVTENIDLQRTLFIVSSKSGTTIETLSHLAYFWEQIPDGDHFVAVTDPGTPLETLARERGVRRTFRGDPNIGGRYSALSYFGLVPAALIGADVGAIVDRAHEMVHACHYCVPSEENPGFWLGTVMGESALAGRDKLTLVLPEPLAALGSWIEQLIAESTGKEGKGIVPIDGEPLGAPGVYGDDRLFVAIGEHPELEAIEQAGHPVVRLSYTDTLQLGGEFFRWQFATAVAGQVLAINPFDQPNVQEAKDATARILEKGLDELKTPSLPSLLEQVQPGDYIAIQAYLPRTAAMDAPLQAARLELRNRYRVATTIGYGPRFLHSTGQLHKGGPSTGVFIQVIDEVEEDIDIPGKPFSFGGLKRAQAEGDLRSLQARGQRVARVTLEELREELR